jgi:pimeloyl-ACP methyl ester carboxylesterase
MKNDRLPTQFATQSAPSRFGRIAYVEQGTGFETLIFMHGLPTSKALWQPVLPHLNANWRVIAFDLHDYGESARLNRLNRPIWPITHAERAIALDELREHLGIDKFHLIAHDLGASVAIDYMGAFGDRVQKLVLISPPVYPDFVEPFIVKLVRVPILAEIQVLIAKGLLLDIAIKRGLVHNKRFLPDVRAAWMQAYAGREGRAALLRNLRWGRPHVMFARYPDFIRAIQSPTLVIQGRQDPYIPPDQATRLQNDIKNCELEWIEDGSHFLPLDTPEQVARQINQFISAE